MRINFAVLKLLKCLLLIFWFDLECCEGVKGKKIRVLLPFERENTEADGHDSTECTSVLWTRCVMELIEATR